MRKVKVLLASYNGEKYISEQIESILQQKDVVIDIVVADDSSSDRTVAVLRDRYPMVNVIVNNPGTGSAARNFIKMIGSLNFDDDFDYIAFSDQDDIWLPTKLSHAVKKLEDTSASLYCSNLTKWDMASGNYSLLKKDFPQQCFDYLFEGGSAGCTYVLTRELAGRLQNFLMRVSLKNWPELSHDWLVYFYARANKFKVYIDSESMIHYRIHSSNVHGHLNKLSLRTIIDKSQQVLSGYHQAHIKHYIHFLEEDTEAYGIYKGFLGNYFQRNRVIWKYNTKLMRDKRKLLIFILLNLFHFK